MTLDDRRGPMSWIRGLRRRTLSRAAVGCEAMEPRALMAADSVAAIVAPPPTTTVVGVVNSTSASVNSTQTVIVTSSTNPKLLEALNTFLGDLEAALQRPGTLGDAQATLQNDLAEIARLAGATGSRAVIRLNADVATIIGAGSITPVQRLAVISDLEEILLGAGIPGSVIVTSANQALAPSHPSPASQDELSQLLADPNALGTPQAGQTRGQGGPSSAVPLGSAGTTGGGDALPGSGVLGKPFRTLLDDLKGIFARVQTVSPAQKGAVRSDFSAIAAVAHRPDARLVAALRQDLDAGVIDGGITADGRAKVSSDLGAVLHDAGVPPRLADRTLLDLEPVIRASDLAPADLRLLLGDLLNLLIARPRAARGS